jgi:hypothetical protein
MSSSPLTKLKLLIQWIRTGRRPRASEWTIGILEGSSPLELRSPDPDPNPVLSRADVAGPAAFVADPFLHHREGRWYCFFELLNRSSEKGEIGAASSLDLRSWRYVGTVLDEPFHLSYPYVFEHAGEVYMVPESSADESIRLYRADPFPIGWTLETILLQGRPFKDSSLVRHDGRWWMFSEVSEGTHDTLALFHSAELHGPWIEHPQSPIVRKDPMTARPAGRVVLHEDRLIRFAQDCSAEYGRALRAFVIDVLTPHEYSERSVSSEPIYGPTGLGWNRLRMHTIDPHEISPGHWIACVDGRG